MFTDLNKISPAVIVNRLCSGITVSQGSVATYAKCGEILITVLLQIYYRIFQRKNESRLRFDRIMAMSLRYLLLAHPTSSKLPVTPVVVAMSTSPSPPVSTTPGYRILQTLLFLILKFISEFQYWRQVSRITKELQS